MQHDAANLVAQPWGLAILVLCLLGLRVLARARDPHAMQRVPRTRVLLGYLVAVAASISAIALASLVGIRPWVEAVPARSALEAMSAAPVSKYFIGALVAWLVAAYLVAPTAAVLVSFRRGNGILLVAACLPIALALALVLSLAWREPLHQFPFLLGSSVCLMVLASVGYALGSGLPLRIQSVAKSAT